MGRIAEHFRAHTNPPVFLISGAVVAAFLLVGVVAPERVGRVAESVQGFITTYLGWFYILVVSFFVGFCVVLMLMCWSLVRAWQEEHAGRVQLHPPPGRYLSSKFKTAVQSSKQNASSD